MYLIDDIWNEIKKYLFHRHLWECNLYKTAFKDIKYHRGFISTSYLTVSLNGIYKFIKIIDISKLGIMETLSMIPLSIKSDEELNDYIYKFKSII
tara:strand:+ start:2714 stop:2998 length:285 start_codon:yes stop_codon:yes gene_type:complete